MFNLPSRRNFKAIVISFPGLLLTFFMTCSIEILHALAILVECSQLSPLTCGTETGLRPNVLTDFHRRWMELSTDM